MKKQKNGQMKYLKTFEEFNATKCKVCGKDCEYERLDGKLVELCETHLLKETRRLKLDKIGKA